MNKNSHIMRIALLAALLTASSAANAQGPSYPLHIPVSGTLTDDENQLLQGFHKVELRLMNAAVGGEVLWAEAFDTEGPYLAVMLGKNMNPLEQRAPLKELVIDGEVTHLEVIIDGEVQRPRIALGAVPYAVAAERANIALMALEAGDAATLNGKSATDFLPATYEATYAALNDKPTFVGNAPLAFDIQGSTHVVSLAPCNAADQFLSWSGSSWGCAPLSDPLQGSTSILIVNGEVALADDGVETRHIGDAQVTSDKIGNNAVVNDHIAANSLLPNKIVGGALTLLSNTAQTVMNTLTIANNAVSVNGTFRASSIALNQPTLRTYRLWADQFRPALVNNGGTISLNENNHAYLSAAPVALLRATLVASLHALPGDAVLDGMTCFYTQEAGSLQGTSFKAVRTPSGGLHNTRAEDIAVVAAVVPNANIKTVSIGPNLNRTLYPNRLHVEVDWRPTVIGQFSKFLGCEVIIKTADPF